MIADHAGGIYRLIPSPRQGSPQEFPISLSQTGIFLSTREHQVQPGLIPYSVNVQGWADGAHVERFMALPDDSRIGNLTNGTVLVQTLSLEREAKNPKSRERIETRLLTRQDGEWVGYSYRWNDNQTDATLVVQRRRERICHQGRSPARGSRRQFGVPKPCRMYDLPQSRRQLRAGGHGTAINQSHDYGGVRDHQLRTLQHIGVFKGTLPKPEGDKLVDPYDRTRVLTRGSLLSPRNCSVCHVEAGGGNSKMELGFTTKPDG